MQKDANKRVEGAAIVTGAGSGIGRAVAKALCVAGIDTLYLLDISAAGLDETKSELDSLDLQQKPDISLFQSDISCPLEVQKVFTEIPRLDYAVNCASVMGHEPKPTTDVTLPEFDSLNDINYRGIWLCHKEELKLMLKNDVRPYKGLLSSSEDEDRIRGQRGSIVDVSSQLGMVGKSQLAALTASKAAVLALVRSDALDFSKPPQHIRINAVCAGFVTTEKGKEKEMAKDEGTRKALSIAPMERMGLPSEIADVVIFLCSGESSFITGSSMVVDGGYIVG